MSKRKKQLRQIRRRKERRAREAKPAPSAPKPTFAAEPLEPRILLSATWVDADTGDPLDGATGGNDAFTGDNADDIADALGGSDTLFGNGGGRQPLRWGR